MEQEINDALIDRVRGTWLGQIAGDALGTTVEFHSADRIASKYPNGLREIVGGGPFRVRAGQVTDDTELALELARTLAQDGADFDAVAQSYVRWCRSHPFDIGMTTQMALKGPEALSKVTFDVVTRRASRTSQANGSVMRISPLAIYGASLRPAKLGEMARQDSRLTHPHPACQEASAAFSRAIGALIRGASREEGWLEALRSAYNEDGRQHGVLGALKAAESEKPQCDGKHIGWVLIALQNAFYHLLNADNLEEGVVETVMSGGDTDTNGCITGALLGAHYGESSIPDQWLETVLSCRSNRGPRYQNHDARDLALAVFNAGLFNGGERPKAMEHHVQSDQPQAPQQRPSQRQQSLLFEYQGSNEDKDFDDEWEVAESKGPSEYAGELRVVVELAKECGRMLLAEGERVGGPRGSGDKADIDDEIDGLIHKRLSEAFPDDTIISEERGRRDGTSARAFIVDPHDGTRDFLNGRRETSISIALVDDGALVLGVVHAPCSTACTGAGGLLASWAEGEPLRKNGRIVTDLEFSESLDKGHTALVSTHLRGAILRDNRDLLAPAAIKHCASIATRLALVAVGDADFALTIGHTLADWDFAAGQALLKGSGGDLVNPSGQALRWRGIAAEDTRCRGYFGSRVLSLGSKIAKRYDHLFQLSPES
jgi:ADP-ribosylglycohydrolase/fructose-1,6-bisphosphatase/inositol monophosphatase family enzyme